MPHKDSTLLRLGSVGIAAGVVCLAWLHSSREAQRTHRFGTVPLNARLTHDLVIENPTAAALALHSVKPSCTCLRLDEQIPTHIPAQGRVTLQVTFLPEWLGPVKATLKLDCPGLAIDEKIYVAEVIPPPDALPSADTVNAAHERLKQQIVLPAAACVSKAQLERLVIDVRPSIDFQASTIVGALNVPLMNLAGLPSSMRSRVTYLLDRGYGSESTARVVTSLRSQGWKDLHIIEGGLAAWNAHGGLITTPMPPESWLISSEDARTSATCPGWVLVAPESQVSRWRLRELFPEVITIPDTSPKSAEAAAATINSRRTGPGASTSLLHVLVATEVGEHATAFVQSFRPKLSGNPVFVLDGGLRGYLDHLRNLKPDRPRQWIAMAQFEGALAELRTRQRLVNACTSCSR